MTLPPATGCFRLRDDPEVTVDLFGSVAILSFYRDAPDEAALARALMERPDVRSVYVKRRPREARGASAELLAPSTPLLGAPMDSLVVEEQGARFEIRPGNGLSVGLYLDARDARAWVRRHARGRRVLNTFAYTCGFGVAAHLGGAARVVNVDASRKVLDWGEQNLTLNGFSPERHDFVAGDTFDWLKRFAKKGEQFDLIILDPPGFATTRTSRFTAQRDYHRLVAAAEPLLAPGASLLAMCNVEQLRLRDFEAQVRRGLGVRPFDVTERFGASAVDFRQPPALKCLVAQVSAHHPSGRGRAAAAP